MIDPVKKPFNKRTRAPKKGYKYSETTSGKIPNPTVVKVKKPVKMKPMRTVASGTNAYGQPTKTVKNKARSL